MEARSSNFDTTTLGHCCIVYENFIAHGGMEIQRSWTLSTAVVKWNSEDTCVTRCLRFMRLGSSSCRSVPVILAALWVAGETPSPDILEKNSRVAMLGVVAEAVLNESTLHISSCQDHSR